MSLKTVPFYEAIGGKAEATLRRAVGPEQADVIRDEGQQLANQAFAKQLAFIMISRLPMIERLRFLCAHPSIILPYLFRMRSTSNVNVDEFVNR